MEIRSYFPLRVILLRSTLNFHWTYYLRQFVTILLLLTCGSFVCMVSLGCGQRQAAQADEARRDAEIRTAREVAVSAGLRAELQALRNENFRLKSELSRTLLDANSNKTQRSELQELRSENSRLKNELSRVRAEASSFKYQHENTKSEFARWKESHVTVLNERDEALRRTSGNPLPFRDTTSQQSENITSNSTDTTPSPSSTGNPAESNSASVYSTYTSRDGRQIVAQLLKITNDTIQIRRKDGQEFTISRTNLSAADQARIETLFMSGIFTETTTSNENDPKPEKFDEIKLMSGWKIARRKGEEENIIGDLLRLLTGCAEPSDEVSVARRFPIYRDIEFLEDIESAKKKLKVATFGSHTYILPGFPQHSFYVYRATLPIDGYQTITLLTDMTRQVLAVQLSRNNRLSSLPDHYYGRITPSHYMLHDMLNYVTRTGRNSRVDWKTVSNESDVVTFESNFRGTTQTQDTLLHLPKQLIAIVLFNIRENW